MDEKRVEEALDRLEKEEHHILKVLEEAKESEKHLDEKRLQKLKHFTIGDFAQSVIGATVFSLPAILNTSFWDYIPRLSTPFLFLVHAVVFSCFFIALNYEYRDTFKWNMTFFKRLAKRSFYVYFSSMMMIVLLLILANKIALNLSNVEVFRNFLAAMSMGLVGSVTFSFLKK